MDHSKSLIDQIEEMLIAGILGAMTLITFANVVTRYGFNKNILWALELTVFLFGWLLISDCRFIDVRSLLSCVFHF